MPAQPPSALQTELPFGAPHAGEPLPDPAALLLQRALPAEAGVWDELRGGEGSLRPAWAAFARWLRPAAGAPLADLTTEMADRAGQIADAIRRDGVTHNVFNAEGAASRPWSLELLPLIIPAAEWAQIEAGTAQRAALLEAVLADLYGPRRLLHEGLLPPALLLRHSGYLRPMQGVSPAGGHWLHMVAFDLARGPEGRWWLIAQRCQAPSGLGYVLHNRLVVARQFPDAFRELRVQHIAASYRRVLDTLERGAEALARAAGEASARVALLTPGPYSETYFEHAYLARYLGIPLVEGGDLAVRDDRLYLKTVQGLLPLHGLLRRVDDDWCDPLELRPDSGLGVPGLLQAVRAGSVVMANAPGSAFLESPALQGFLPGISEALTGQKLALPSLPTWWCGEPAAWADVREQLADKVLRTTFPEGGRTTQVLARQSDGATLAELIAAVEADPDGHTVQGRLRFSRAPIWSAGMVVPRPAVVRVYAVADGRGGWHVLPGGMTRVAQREDGSVSMQRGGSSLDTWVLTEGPVDSFSMLPQRLSVDDIGARAGPVASRTGENLFWLGRYTERTEQLVRLAQVTMASIESDTDAGADSALLDALTALAIRSGLVPTGVPALTRSPQVFERAMLAALADEQGTHGATSVAFNLAALHRAAQALRERLSPEQWRLLRQMHQGWRAAILPEGAGAAELPGWAPVEMALDRLALQLAAATGAQTDRMVRDAGWRLMAVGRLIERLYGLAARLDSFLAAAAWRSAAGIDALLELFDSAISYRARYQHHEGLLPLADLLVLDSNNPRAFAGVLRRLRTELSKLPGAEAAAAPLLARLPAAGAGLTLEDLRDASDAQIAVRLRTLAVDLGQRAASLADAIGLRYFSLGDGAVADRA